MAYLAAVKTQPATARSEEELGWSELLARIALHTRSIGGRALVLSLRPAADESSARLRQETMREVFHLDAVDALFGARELTPVVDAVLLAQKGATLSGAELFSIAETLDLALDISRGVSARRGEVPGLFRALAVDAALIPLASALGAALLPGGIVSDRASPELRKARREVAALSREIQSKLADLIGRYRDVLQDGYSAERDGRTVLPVRSDAHDRFDGAILGSSASGATLYVEPAELSGLTSRLRLLENAVLREEEAVRRTLSRQVQPLAESVLFAEEACALADFFLANLHFSRKIGAVLCEFSAEPGFSLKDARHPLLADRGIEVVPFDLDLSGGEGLVVSGPNAGGKTVALKTLGLFAMMQASGLPLPADFRSSVGFFSVALADIGDDQSLAQSLSTFSGHVERVHEMLERAEPGVLLLFDELMAGTDPNEGAALATSLLGEFLDRSATVVVTTHYEALKLAGSEDSRIRSAAVGYDFERMEPTFRLYMGRSGASSALIVAERHGLPLSVIEKAKVRLPKVALDLENERKKAEALAVELLSEQKELRVELERQRLLREGLEKERERLREAKRKVLEDESDALRTMLREARLTIDKVRAGLQGASEPARLTELSRELSEVAETVAVGGAVDRAVRERAAAPVRAVQVGMRVHVASLGLDGEVVEAPATGPVRVLLGGMRLSVARSDLKEAKGPKTAQEKPKKTSFSTTVSSTSHPEHAPVRTEDVTLDLRGQRVEPALMDLDSFIDTLLRRREAGGYVLHGHGTGAMKDAVRSHLGSHPAVSFSRAAERDEGGDAFTILWVGPR